ncbi:poly-gamma-glutamate hydrolase family protein [Streptomyces sp. NPDC020298]|uniref:poly-gamma-glutamate hydrolase family protein n=1 Tax=unclassified Streptomyces TaxID=2593676 RepID=UPI00340A5317
MTRAERTEQMEHVEIEGVPLVATLVRGGDRGGDVGLLALHGSNEGGTAELAHLVARRCGATSLVFTQPGTPRPVHIPSPRMAVDHCALLRAFLARVSLTVSLHGHMRPEAPRTVFLGGGNRDAALVLARELRACSEFPACAPTPGTHARRTVSQDRWLRHMTCDTARRSHAPNAAAPALRADDGELRTGPGALAPGFQVVTHVPEIPAGLRGLHPRNPVNLTRRAGVQVELPLLARTSGPAKRDGVPDEPPPPVIEALVAGVGRLTAGPDGQGPATSTQEPL